MYSNPTVILRRRQDSVGLRDWALSYACTLLPENRSHKKGFQSFERIVGHIAKHGANFKWPYMQTTHPLLIRGAHGTL